MLLIRVRPGFFILQKDHENQTNLNQNTCLIFTVKCFSKIVIIITSFLRDLKFGRIRIQEITLKTNILVTCSKVLMIC